MGTLEYFPAFFGYLDSLKLLDDAQVGRVFRAALRYAKDGTLPDLDAVEMMAFAFIRGDIDRAKVKYEEKCERLRANGMKGGRPPSENQMEPEGTKRFSENQMEPEEPKQNNTKQDKTTQHKGVGVASYDAAPAHDTRTRAAKKTKEKQFVPPTVEEVRAYCEEKGITTVDPEHFIEYYTESDWKKQNGEPVRNWKSTVLTWAQRDKERGYTAKPQAQTRGANKGMSEPSFETDDFFDAALQRTYGENWQFFKDASG